MTRALTHIVCVHFSKKICPSLHNVSITFVLLSHMLKVTLVVLGHQLKILNLDECKN